MRYLLLSLCLLSGCATQPTPVKVEIICPPKDDDGYDEMKRICDEYNKDVDELDRIQRRVDREEDKLDREVERSHRAFQKMIDKLED